MNAQLPACKAGTLPLSYVPMCVWRVIERPFSVCRGGHCTWSAISRVSTPIVILREGTAPLTSAGSDPTTIHSARLIPGCQRSLPAVTCFLVVCTDLRALRAAAIRAGRFPHGLSRFRLVGPAGYEPATIQRHDRLISPMCGGNPRTRRALLVRQYRLFQASRSAAYWLPKERDYCCFLTTLPFGWRSMTYPRGSNPHHAIKPLRRVTAILLLTRRRQPGLVGPVGVAPTSAGFLWPCAQTVCPMRPSLRAVKRLSALPERRK